MWLDGADSTHPSWKGLARQLLGLRGLFGGLAGLALSQNPGVPPLGVGTNPPRRSQPDWAINFPPGGAMGLGPWGFGAGS